MIPGDGKNFFEGFRPPKDEEEAKDDFGWGRQNSEVTNVPPESTKLTEKKKPKAPKAPLDFKH